MKTVTRLLLRMFPPVLGAATGVLLAMLGCIHLGEAHAAARLAVAAEPTAASPPLDLNWLSYVGIALAAAGGLVKVLEVLLVGLRWLAPRTKTTLDDRARDDLQIVRDDIAAMLKVVGGLVPTAGVPVTSSPPTLTIAPPPRDSQAGFIRGDLLPWAAFAGGSIILACAIIGGSCATGKSALAEGSVAFLECEDGHLDADMLADAKKMASDELRHLLAGKAAPDPAALKADLAPLKSDLARCGWAAAIAALGTLIKPPAGLVSLDPVLAPDAALTRERFGVAARQLGLRPMRMADGMVL